MSRERFEHLVEGFYIFKTKHRFPCGNHQKGIRRGETRPSQRQRTDLMGLRISKENTFLSPGPAL
jgi:hypothetical protein